MVNVNNFYVGFSWCTDHNIRICPFQNEWLYWNMDCFNHIHGPTYICRFVEVIYRILYLTCKNKNYNKLQIQLTRYLIIGWGQEQDHGVFCVVDKCHQKPSYRVATALIWLNNYIKFSIYYFLAYRAEILQNFLLIYVYIYICVSIIYIDVIFIRF